MVNILNALVIWLSNYLRSKQPVFKEECVDRSLDVQKLEGEVSQLKLKNKYLEMRVDYLRQEVRRSKKPKIGTIIVKKY